MTQLELFRDEPLPPTSCRKFWDRPQPGNEFSRAWEAGQIDFDALDHHLQIGQLRAARAGKKEALAGLREHARWLADQVARKNPNFDPELFHLLLNAQMEGFEKGKRK